jgi:hypothetical protein
MAANRPVHEIRFGHVKAAIWANKTQNGIRHNVTFVRIYRDDDQWKTSESFGRNDLPLLGVIAGMAYLWIFQQGSESNEDRSASA